MNHFNNLTIEEMALFTNECIDVFEKIYDIFMELNKEINYEMVQYFSNRNDYKIYNLQYNDRLYQLEYTLYTITLFKVPRFSCNVIDKKEVIKLYGYEYQLKNNYYSSHYNSITNLFVTNVSTTFGKSYFEDENDIKYELSKIEDIESFLFQNSLLMDNENCISYALAQHLINNTQLPFYSMCLHFDVFYNNYINLALDKALTEIKKQ